MPTTLDIAKKYKAKLDLIQTEIAIKSIKEYFAENLANVLNLTKVSAPIFLKEGNGLNDNLNGIERMISFEALDINNAQIQIVQSLAKWKRMALARYGFTIDEGLYTDMNAIRIDETLGNLHSIYVDQWDWEKVISEEMRTLDTLKTEVAKIYEAIKATEEHVQAIHPEMGSTLPPNIHFVTTQELENMDPDLSIKEREDKIAKQYGAVFIMQIGGLLQSGDKHDGRSPDYDDWTLNGDIVLWYPELERAFEVSSMGIRVNAEAMKAQLKLSNHTNRQELDYHKSILNDELPLTIGGGIGQSRLCMFLLKKIHIGEVQVSVWNEQIIRECREANIPLL